MIVALFNSNSAKRLMKRLVALRAELERAREDQRIAEQQLLAVSDQDEDDRVRMIVSENRYEEQRWQAGHRNRELMEKNLVTARGRVRELEVRERQLVDELAAAP